METLNCSSQLKKFGTSLGSVLRDSLAQEVTRLCVQSSVYSSNAAATDLNAAQWFLLCFMHSLFAEDLLQARFLITLSTSLIQLKSTYLKKWLRGDFNFVREDLVRGLKFLMTLAIQENIQVPEVLLTILSGLAGKYNIDDFMIENDRDMPDASLLIGVERNNIAAIISAAKRGANVDMKISCGDSLYHLAVDLNCIESINGLGYLKANVEALDAELATPMQRAVLKDNGRAVQALAAAGADFKIKVKDGNTLVHLAVMKGCNNALNVLLEIGADCNVKNFNGLSPILLAVRSSNVMTVELLLKSGVDQSSDELHVACQLNNTDIVRKLLNAGWKSDVMNKEGLLPIHLCRDNATVEVLLSKRTSIDAKTSSGDTALHLAASEGNVDLLQFLICSGANVNEINNNGEMPIFLAAGNNKVDVIKILLEKKAKMNELDKKGFTVAHKAVECGSLSILKILHAVGTDIRIATSEGLNALHIAAKLGHNQIVHYLSNNEMYDHLNTTCNFSEWSYDKTLFTFCQPFNWTALHLAVFKGHLEIVQILLALTNSDPNVKDSNGLTLLDLAACSGNVSVVKKLLEHGAKVEKALCPCHLAAYEGHLEILKLLLENGSKVNQAIDNRYTPLHAAASKGHLEIVKFLLDHQADVNGTINGVRGWYTPLYYATNNNHKAVMDLLQSRGGKI